MRDLRQDLEDYHRYMAERSLKAIDLMVNSFPYAIDRALRCENFIKGLNKELADAQDQKSRAEAEVERYKLMVKSITGGLDEAIEAVHFLETENAKLQLALKKACDMLPACPDELGRLDDMFLRAAERDLRELDEEGD